MAITRTFTVQELDALGLPDKLPKDRVLLDEFFQEYRWEIENRLVFRSPDDEQIYEIYYRTPSTEMGEGEDPWNDASSVDATLVEQRTLFRQDWRPVSSPQAKDEVQTNLDELIRRGLKCAVCHSPVFFQDCPTGGWWIHHTHPDDGHDAVSLIWGQDTPPWVPEES